MGRRVAFPSVFRGLVPVLYRSPDLDIPMVYAARGRWRSGPMHTFSDDYRQEFFFRRPEEGLLVAAAALNVVAPDYTIWTDDPVEWADYQVWRSAVVAFYWQMHGVDVLPVVAFAGTPSRFVLPGSAWAIRGPTVADDKFMGYLLSWAKECNPSLLVVFGRAIPEFGVPMVNRRLAVKAS